MSPYSRGAFRPSFACVSPSSKVRGCREGRVAAAPGAPAQKIFARARKPQVQAVTTGLPCAVVLRLIRALLGEPSRLPPSPPRSFSASLGLGAQALGRQDHTSLFWPQVDLNGPQRALLSYSKIGSFGIMLFFQGLRLRR